MSPPGAIFIVGHPRSGTSLLRALLDGHPDLLVLPFESHLFDWVGANEAVHALLARTRLWPTLHRHRPSLSRTDAELMLEKAFEGADNPRARLLALVDGWRELTGAATPVHWVEKTPRHLSEADTLLRWFPDDVRVVIMRRDPRDVMASALRQKPSRSIFSLALTAHIAHEVARGYESDERFLEVGYEALVRDPEAVMGEVGEFIGITEHPVLVQPTVMGAKYSGNSRFESELDGVSQSGVGRFRTVLSRSQLEKAEVLLASVMEAGGYASTTSERPATQLSYIPSRAAITGVVASGLWRFGVVRSAFGGA